ncbi:hypothetical protein DQ04_01991030 [Trypanosoma grayi]|uniref:hypothetical protein n=1 Tax=Trypanosoma grayi TaxID=71804 RepID=UPI0004F49287|nr:hypothetical protein DQ04_01991030 [Trypanosoma grayi]KEG12114.1 hypothetical protein DQ04_01991030 [Trypanosoma grayi]
MRFLQSSALCYAAASLRHASSARRCVESPLRLSDALKQSGNGTVGLELHLPPLSCTAFAGASEMNQGLRKATATLDTVLRASADKALSLDYVALRCGAAVPSGESWTQQACHLALSFMREVTAHALAMVPVLLVVPVTAANTLPMAYLGGMFETLHRVGLTNVLLELPHPTLAAVSPTANGALHEVPLFPMNAAVGGWQSLLHAADSRIFSQRMQPMPMTALFPWMVAEEFLSRFCVGLSVDVHASLRSLAHLEKGKREGNDLEMGCSSGPKGKKEDTERAMWERILKSQRSARDEGGFQQLFREQQQQQHQQQQNQELQMRPSPSASEDSTLTLDVPSKEFSSMLLAQHESFLAASGGGGGGGGDGGEQDAMLLAQFLQQTPKGHASNKTAGFGEEKAVPEEHKSAKSMNTTTNGSDTKRQEQRSGYAYWQVLGELTKCVGAQYLCMAPCINPAALEAWQKAYAAECTPSGKTERGDDVLPSPVASLPLVSAVWPLLRPTQLESASQSVDLPAESATGTIRDDDLSDALNLFPQEVLQELRHALREIPPALRGEVLRPATRPRRETQIHYEEKTVRLRCCNGNYTDDIWNMIGACVAVRHEVLSELPYKQATRIRAVEEGFRCGPMKRALDNMKQFLRAGYVGGRHHRHLLLSVPRDTELSVLLESLDLLCGQSA